MSPKTISEATTATTMEESRSLVDQLSQPRAYPGRPRKVRLIETHISWVFLTHRYAYKLKKPIKFEFLDFSTVERRHAACLEEVELNRRLAPDIYLGVAPVTASYTGSYRVGGTRTPVDWLVCMRRLPADRSLDRLILQKTLTDAEVGQIASTLADFYGALPPLSLHTELYRQRIAEHVQSNGDELSRPCYSLNVARVKRVQAAQVRYLQLRPEVFDNRVRDGRIVEGHGDLRPEHIYLTPQPVIIDCVEFNQEFRRLDVLDELSFLAIECAKLGADDVGGRILDQYCQSSGDRPPAALLSFYMCYRASVRAKVSLLRGAQLPDGERDATLATAEAYLALADRFAAELGPPLLIVIRGPSGAGKSALATALSESLGIEHLQTDRIRRDFMGASEERADFDQGSYSLERRMQIYDEMFNQAGTLLAEGQTVVLDGTFLTHKLRTMALLLARHHGAIPVFIRCDCPPEIAAQRITNRMAGEHSPSEAQPEFVHRQLEQEEADTPATAALSLETTGSVAEMLESVYEQLRQSTASG